MNEARVESLRDSLAEIAFLSECEVVLLEKISLELAECSLGRVVEIISTLRISAAKLRNLASLAAIEGIVVQENLDRL